MYNVSQNFKRLANANGRTFDVKVDIDGVEYSKEIVSLNIQKSIQEEQGLVLGTCVAGTLTLEINLKSISAKAKIKSYVRFLDDAQNSEWLQLGCYFVDTAPISLGTASITAFDKMIQLEKQYVKNEQLIMPCPMQDFLAEICKQGGFETSFICQPFMLNYQPINYTLREMLGFIASAHGGCGVFDNQGKFTVVNFANTNEKVELKNQFEQAIETDTFTVGAVDIVISDDLTIKRGKADEFSTISFFNPLGDEKIADYVFKNLGGLIYKGLTASKQGFGYLEVGDLCQTVDNNNRVKIVNIIISELELNFSAGEFTENITSSARTKSQEEFTHTSDIEKEISNKVEKLVDAVYHIENSSTQNLSAKENEIINIKFDSNAKCTPIFHCEININILQAGTIIFRYVYNQVEYRVKPRQIVGIGDWIITLFLPLIAEENRGNEFQVFMSSETATGYIDKAQLQASINSQGLSTQNSKWDGVIKLNVDFAPVTLCKNLATSKLSNAVKTTLQTPKLNNINVGLNTVNLGQAVQVGNFTNDFNFM